MQQCKGAPIWPPTTAYQSQSVETICIYMYYDCGPQSHLCHSGYAPIFQRITPTCMHRLQYYSVRVHSYAHPQHLKVLKLCIHIAQMWGTFCGGLQPQSHDTTMSFRFLPSYPNFPKIHPHHPIFCLLHSYYTKECKGKASAHICPSTAYQGVKLLCIHIIWLVRDGVCGGLQPQSRCHKV